MPPQRISPAAFIACVVLALLVGGLAGHRIGAGRAPTQQGESSEEPEAAEESASVPAPRRLGITLADLDAEDADARERARAILREADYDLRSVLGAVVRPAHPEWNGRALADLLSTSPDDVLPPLLHRLVHSAPVHRSGICRALGAPRTDTTAASAILTVRALLDPFDEVRERAWTALEAVNPPAAEAVAAHYQRGLVITDGSAAGLDASLLIGHGAPFAAGPARRMLLDALRAEGARFGNHTVIRVGAFLAPLPGGETFLEEAMHPQNGFRSLDEEAVSLLASVGPAIVPLLRRRLTEPGVPDWVPLTLGRMGSCATDAVPDLLRLVVEGSPIWRPALRAAAGLASEHSGVSETAAAAEALLPALHDADMGAHVAWALGQMCPTSPAVPEALCIRLVHRLSRGRAVTQAEGALICLVARRHGFDRIAELLDHDQAAVRRAAARILALCHARDCEAASERLSEVVASAPTRAERQTAERALRLLSADEPVREAERKWRISSLSRELEWD